MPLLPQIPSVKPKPAALHRPGNPGLPTLPRLTTRRGAATERCRDYVDRRRQNFLVNHVDEVAKKEIERLATTSENASRLVELERRQIEEKSRNFYILLSDINKQTDNAVIEADQETKVSTRKLSEADHLQCEIVEVKNDITKNQELLADAESHLQFLQTVLATEDANKLEFGIDLENYGELLRKFSVLGKECLRYLEVKEDFCSDFQHQNSWLTANLHEHDEKIKTMKETEEKLSVDLQTLANNCAELEKTIKQTKTASPHTSGTNDDMDKIHQLVTGIYEQISQETNDADINPLQMLTIIEIHLENLLEIVEKMPGEKVAQIRQERKKKRKLKIREEKIRAQMEAAKEICPRFTAAFPSAII